eukprot:SM000100S09439  [mRNA]  locus=s100:425636:428172:+ [translate_table: standard]
MEDGPNEALPPWESPPDLRRLPVPPGLITTSTVYPLSMLSGRSESWSSASSYDDTSSGEDEPQVEVVPTRLGTVNVTVVGNRRKPGLVTYHDIGLDHTNCFQGLFLCADIATLLLHNFCIYHIDSPGHETNAADMAGPDWSVDDLVNQVKDIVSFFRIQVMVGLGVTGGAYILTQFAIQHPERVLGLILVSPICQAPTWTEWAYSKALASVLHYYGWTTFAKDTLLQRYFCQENGNSGPTPEAVRTFRRDLERRNPHNVARYVRALAQRRDISENLRTLQCPSLVISGQNSSFLGESLHMITQLSKDSVTYIEVPTCGALVTEERPNMMQRAMERFLGRLGFQRALFFELRRAPRSPTSPLCSSEALSPQGMGVKLKPIKTKVERDSVNRQLADVL